MQILQIEVGQRETKADNIVLIEESCCAFGYYANKIDNCGHQHEMTRVYDAHTM